MKRPQFRKLHYPSIGVMGIIAGGLLRVLAVVLQWPPILVLLSETVLLIAISWILMFDLFPIFLQPFYFIRHKFLKRNSFMVALILLFVISELFSRFLPSSRPKDMMTTLTFLSFMSSVIWFIGIFVFAPFTPILKHLRRRSREAERVTFADVITSVAVIYIPTVFLSFVFSPTGLNSSVVTPYQIFITALLTNILMAGYIYLMIIRPHIFTWRQLGIRKVDKEDWWLTLRLVIIISVALILLQALFSKLGVPLRLYSFSSRDGAYFAFFMLVFVTPFVEELFFRGYLFRGLLIHHTLPVSYLTSALLFAFLHPPLLVMSEVFLVGLLLCYIVKESKSIWPGVLIHMLNNAIVLWYLLYR